MEENNKYILYVHTNKINNKKYIGITCQKPNDRWRNGEGYKECIYFYNAIKKYKWNNFNHEILHEKLTKKEAENLEIEYIKKCNTTNINYGYNIQNGGNTSGTHSTITKMKISKANKGKLKSNITKQKLSQSAKKREKTYKENNLIYKLIRTKKFIDYLKTKKRKVINLDTHETFDSITDASIKLNTLHQHIWKSCNDGRIHGGYRFAYYENYQNNKIIIKNDNRGKNKKKVICLNTLEIYESAFYLRKKFGLRVDKVCNGKRKSAGKHLITGEPLRWMYYDEYNEIN